MQYRAPAPFVIFAAAVACGVLFVSGPGAVLAFGLLGLLSGALMRSWRALPLLLLGLLLGAAVRIARDAPWIFAAIRLDSATLLSVGKGALGLSISYGLLMPLLAAPVAAGRWLATPRSPRTLRTWRG